MEIEFDRGTRILQAQFSFGSIALDNKSFVYSGLTNFEDILQVLKNNCSNELEKKEIKFLEEVKEKLNQPEKDNCLLSLPTRSNIKNILNYILKEKNGYFYSEGKEVKFTIFNLEQISKTIKEEVITAIKNLVSQGLIDNNFANNFLNIVKWKLDITSENGYANIILFPKLSRIKNGNNENNDNSNFSELEKTKRNLNKLMNKESLQFFDIDDSEYLEIFKRELKYFKISSGIKYKNVNSLIEIILELQPIIENNIQTYALNIKAEEIQSNENKSNYGINPLSLTLDNFDITNLVQIILNDISINKTEEKKSIPFVLKNFIKENKLKELEPLKEIKISYEKIGENPILKKGLDNSNLNEYIKSRIKQHLFIWNYNLLLLYRLNLYYEKGTTE